MREADVAIRLRQPTQPDLIQRKLFSVHFHAYASPDYLKRFGTPRTIDQLDNHRIIMLGGEHPDLSAEPQWPVGGGARGKGPRTPHLDHQQRARPVARLPARPRRRAAAGLPGRGERRAGAAVRRIRTRAALDAYFVYPEELKSVARVQVFRDFLVNNAQRCRCRGRRRIRRSR
jgi:hypothetical protein